MRNQLSSNISPISVSNYMVLEPLQQELTISNLLHNMSISVAFDYVGTIGAMPVRIEKFVMVKYLWSALLDRTNYKAWQAQFVGTHARQYVD